MKAAAERPSDAPSRLRETTAWMQEVERRRMPKPRVPEGRERVWGFRAASFFESTARNPDAIQA